MFKSILAIIILFSSFYSPNLWSSEDYNNCILNNMTGTISDVAAKAILDICTIRHIDKSNSICAETDAKVTNDIIFLKNIAEPFSGENYCQYLNALPKSRGDIQDGKRHNKWTWWHKNGNVGLEINYIKGKKNGKFIKWYKMEKDQQDEDDLIGPISLKGQIAIEENYKDGKKDGQSIKWYPHGQIQLIDNYKNDKKDGKSTAWYPSGQIAIEENYKDGKKDGQSIEWYAIGQMELEENYKDGKRDGKSTVWYPDGKIESEEDYKDGKRDGKSTARYRSGQIGVEENYKDGKKDGKSTMWYPDGNVFRNAIYEVGVCISGDC